jgi:hypothetical protein
MLAADPFYYNTTLVDAVRESGADAAFLCELTLPATTISKAIADAGVPLKSYFITLAPAFPEYVAQLGRDKAEHALTAGQVSSGLGCCPDVLAPDM